ncbi:WXG100 family type VII secretion target [Herpetosiphon sp. NSE202]|uniref:WXG100 family type VII secretion target n=1 Tax=Herpetosiphon sp. NSE202 TaxID=3351349 RepID=UPI003636BFE4
MAADLVQSDYERLGQVATQFQKLHDQQTQMEAMVRQTYQQLRSTWQGDAAVAFFAEMDDAIFPTLKRLQTALTSASTLTSQISQTFRQAEEEASKLMKFDGNGGAAGGGAGAAAGGGAGSGASYSAEGSAFAAGGGSGGLDPAVSAKWATLTPNQQAAVLQSISNKICDEYGIEHVPVTVSDLADPPGLDLFGYRNDKGVFIDLDNMGDADRVLNTVAHEVRHEVQRQMGILANPSSFDKFLRSMGIQESPKWPVNDVTEAMANEWHENFANYISPESDFAKYESQPVESDARKYGENYRDNLTLSEFESHIPNPTPQPVPVPTPGPTPVPPTATPTPTPVGKTK